MKVILLKAKREASVQRFHPWVFSGGIAQKPDDLEDGEWVQVHSREGILLGQGHYQAGSIMVRLLTFGAEAIDQDFWNQKIQRAYAYRQTLGLTEQSATNCYRLVHAEGDGLPGLIIDIYGRGAVMQCHSHGMHRDRLAIAQALRTVLGPNLDTIYDKSEETLGKQPGFVLGDPFLLGQGTQETVQENGCRFTVDWVSGQKTGFFLDQRDNRALLAHYAAGKTVLNAFAYSGGFSVYALRAGATWVDSVDASAKAMEWATANVALNGFGPDQHQSHTADVLHFLRQNPQQYDVMIVDPPAYAKNLEKRHNAIQGYKRLNALALERVKPGGVLFTFSCSQVVNRQLFYDTLVAAALEAGRQVRVAHQLHQPADHPINLFHPEGEYLKGLVLRVD